MSMTQEILINADLGEGCESDEALMPYIDLASIACGGHAGSHQSMHDTVGLCLRHHVKAGAHPAYEDRKNFGRTSRLESFGENTIIASCVQQIKQLADTCAELNTRLHYVKAHGALYHDLAKHSSLADKFANAIRDLALNLFIIGPPNSQLKLSADKTGITYLTESFADRRYGDNCNILPRNLQSLSPLLEDPLEVQAQVALLQRGSVKTVSGLRIPLKSQTICIHGDTDNAVELAKAARAVITR